MSSSVSKTSQRHTGISSGATRKWAAMWSWNAEICVQQTKSRLPLETWRCSEQAECGLAAKKPFLWTGNKVLKLSYTHKAREQKNGSRESKFVVFGLNRPHFVQWAGGHFKDEFLQGTVKLSGGYAGQNKFSVERNSDCRFIFITRKEKQTVRCPVGGSRLI